MEDNVKNISKTKKIVIAICSVVILAGIVLAFSMGQTKKENNDAKKETPKVYGEMKDGEVIDYEKSGNLTLKEYKGLKVTVTPSKEDVYRYILNEIEEKEITVSGEERVKKGDWVMMDYSGAIGGQAMDTLEESGIVIQVGSEDLFNADFQRKLTGLTVGEEYTFDVTFPENYFDLEVAGEKVTFTVTVSFKFNEAFVKPLSKNKYSTHEEYFEYAKGKERQENVDAAGDMIWDEYIEKCKVKEYPEGSKKQAYADLQKQYNGIGELSGLSYEEVISGWGMTDEDVKDLAKDEVKGRMIAKSIAAKEKLSIDNERYREFLVDEVSPDDEDATIEELEKSYIKDISTYPKDDMLVLVVKDFLGKHAKQE